MSFIIHTPSLSVLLLAGSLVSYDRALAKPTMQQLLTVSRWYALRFQSYFTTFFSILYAHTQVRGMRKRLSSGRNTMCTRATLRSESRSSTRSTVRLFGSGLTSCRTSTRRRGRTSTAIEMAFQKIRRRWMPKRILRTRPSLQRIDSGIPRFEGCCHTPSPTRRCENRSR